MALGKSAYDSGGYNHLVKASRAVDGNRDQKWTGNSCSHTGDILKPWWLVDLGHTYEVSSLRIYNRVDCCGECKYMNE